MICGHSKFVVMLGHPIGQAKTPKIFNLWAQKTKSNVFMVPVDVTPDDLPNTILAIKGWKNCLGVVLTVPHKQRIIPLLDFQTEQVNIVGAANVITKKENGTLCGDITDGLGFVSALKKNQFNMRGIDAHILGAGGAGSAIALALIDNGVNRLLLSDINIERRDTLIGRLKLARPNTRVLSVKPADFQTKLIVNATPIGMNGDISHPFPLEKLYRNCLVADIVPSPELTPWLIEAKNRGHRIQTGPQMIKNQFDALLDRLIPTDLSKRS